MTREEYIEAVKVKLEEISSFDEPTAFIASDDSAQDTVKPIIDYIDASLDEAARNCLRSLPLSLLHADINKNIKGSVQDETSPFQIQVNNKGVGYLRHRAVGSAFFHTGEMRLVRLRSEGLQKDVTTFITSEDPAYSLQQNQYTRGGTAKPIVVWNSTENDIEIYSYAKSYYNQNIDDFTLLYIPTHKDIQVILSPISEYIILECATIVANILGNAQSAQNFQADIDNKIQSLLK